MIGGLLIAAALALRFGLENDPELQRSATMLWWAGMGCAALGLVLCRGLPRWMSGFLLAACLLLTA
ncbi:hypothetical protein LzC2_18930 [Planctomycetes bacterium LzC2]|uniref:Uncharacterized protein n=1 Tax=Alienimonas chondri TaxID=2681879 RepID=A0ABX1VDE6_9PLAN|nr:hypothetical protein [Alienimonas chondri]